MRLNFFIFSLFCALLPVSLLAQAHADCATAMEICKKQVYHIDRAGGEGKDNTEADFVSCFMNGDNHGQAEENSTWIKFEIAESGNITFAITPHRMDDDIDFVVYMLPEGNCAYKKIVRCCAAGDSESVASSSACMGETGLRTGERASSRDAGCSDAGDNAWAAPLKVVKGEKYVILVSNVTSKGPGFSIRFGGTAKLPCEIEKEKPVAAKPTPAKPAPVKPTPEKPKETKKKPVETIKVPAPSKEKPAMPTSIGGREVTESQSIKIKSRTFKVKIWDGQVSDGDVVSFYLGANKIVDKMLLTKEPKEIEIILPDAQAEHFFTVYAEDFGKAEPCSARVSIDDGVQVQTLDLVAGRAKQQSVRIVFE